MGHSLEHIPVVMVSRSNANELGLRGKCELVVKGLCDLASFIVEVIAVNHIERCSIVRHKYIQQRSCTIVRLESILNSMRK
jgi:hypothetical protein